MWRKRISFLVCMLCLLVTSVSLAHGQEKWTAIILGHGRDNVFYYNPASIHYQIKDNKIDKNIIVYQEKMVNRDTITLTCGDYSITDCKLNLANKTLFLGTQTFYKSNGEKRWSSTPTYLIWYPITAGTMGASRFQAVADYVAHHPDIIAKQTQALLEK